MACVNNLKSLESTIKTKSVSVIIIIINEVVIMWKLFHNNQEKSWLCIIVYSGNSRFVWKSTKYILLEKQLDNIFLYLDIYTNTVSICRFSDQVQSLLCLIYLMYNIHYF